MHPELYYTIARQRSAELQRAGADARLARDVRAGQNNPRHSKPIARVSLQLARVTGRFAHAAPMSYEAGAEATDRSSAPTAHR